MRFDDMAATVIAQGSASPDARRSGWLQLVDLAAQGRNDAEIPGAVFECLTQWRSAVPLSERQRAARAISAMPIPADLFRFFAADAPVVVAPLVAAADYPAETWRVLLPALPPPVRALLRHRDDLDSKVIRALESFGASDLILSAPGQMNGHGDFADLQDFPVADLQQGNASVGNVPIRDLVDRIEAYRRDRPLPFMAEPATEDEAPLPAMDSFRFETDNEGAMLWVQGVPRGALIGMTLAAAGAAAGVDGQVSGAFRQRAPFRNARLTVAGDGAAGGQWRISAVPFFTARDGRFAGYRGTARRPRLDEVARVASVPGLYGSGFRPEALRQLVHELRTPLNAILGFAEMIDGQILGPAAQDYRARAHDIRGEARKLLAAVDDLDTAARADSNALQLEQGALDGGMLLEELCAELAVLSDERGVRLRVVVDPGLPMLHVDSAALERMFGRLLSSAIAVSAPGEQLSVRLRHGEAARAEAGGVVLDVERPAALAGQGERALLDPGYSPEGDWPDAPLLGLGFALRLVRNLADAAHGGFAILPDRFLLALPAVTDGIAAGEGVQ